MAQIIPQWTLQAMQDAEATRQFILVTPAGSSRVNITDARTLWAVDPTILFQTGYRIAGTPANITAVLLPLGITQEDIGQLINTAIASDNYSGQLAPIYNEELSNYNAWNRSVIKANMDSLGAKLFDVMVAVNPEVAIKVKTAKQAKTIGLTGVTKAKPRIKTTKSLFDVISQLPPEKVLDVSGIDANGVGYRKVNPPTQRSRKYGSPNLPVISSDLEHYLMAIRLLPGGEQQYAADVAYMTQLFNQLKTAKLPGAILTVPIPGTVPTVPIPGTVPTVPIPGTVPTVPIPGTVPMVPIPGNVPMVPIPGNVPVMPVQGPQPITLPQVEPTTPTQTFPIFSKAQRKQRTKAATAAQVAIQGLPQGVIFPVPTVPVPGTAIPIPGTTQMINPTMPLVPTVPVLRVPGAATPNMTPIQIPNQLADVQTLFETEDEEEYEEDEDEYEEEYEDEEDEEEDEEEAEERRGLELINTGITQPQTPTIPTPQIPTITIPQTPTVQIPTIPTPQTLIVQTPQTLIVQTPQTPTIPVVPRSPTIPVVPRSPTIPVVPRSPTPQIPTPQTSTIPVSFFTGISPDSLFYLQAGGEGRRPITIPAATNIPVVPAATNIPVVPRSPTFQ